MSAVPPTVRGGPHRRRRAARLARRAPRRSSWTTSSGYAEQETPSDDLALLGKGLAHVEGWLTDRLGNPRTGPDTSPPSTATSWCSTTPVPVRTRWLSCAHYDTVWGAGTLDGWPVTGGRGPRRRARRLRHEGRAGAGGLGGARAARRRVPHPPLRLLLNGDEEIGSPFSRPLIERACADAAAVLVFEASADGAVKTARKGVGIFDVHACGASSRTRASTRSAGPAPSTRSRRLVLHAARGRRPGGGHDRQRRRAAAAARAPTSWRAPPQAGVDVRVRSVEAQERIDAAAARR